MSDTQENIQTNTQAQNKNSLFIWYHAAPDSVPLIKQWLEHLFQTTGIHGSLFVRHTDAKSTFMETYENIGYEALKKIEILAAKQPYFETIQRQCESFEKIHPSE